MSAPNVVPFNLNWNVDLTAERILKLGRGLLQLSLSDDVQPLAVWACEAYGAKLPMCLETRLKMERLAKRQYTTFKQWGMLIGFTRQDTASELATRNDAGVRFLGLAAALLSFGSTFQAAQVLHVLLSGTTTSRDFLPTVQQLKGVFGVLEHKIGCSGFADTLYGWDMLLKSSSSGIQSFFIDPDTSSRISDGKLLYNTQEDIAEMGLVQANPNSNPLHRDQPGDGPPSTSLQQNADDAEEPAEAGIMLLPRIEPPSTAKVTKIFGVFRKTGCPPANNIAKLIQAMAEIERIGEASSAVLRTPAKTAAWCIAFIRWCLGTTPTLRVMQENGTCVGLDLFKPHSSKFTVEIGTYDSNNFDVRTFRNVGNLDRLLWESRAINVGSTPWAGMVKAKILFQHRLRDLQTRHHLFHVVDALLIMAQELTHKFCVAHDTLMARTPKPFPGSDRIINLIADLFDIQKVISRVQGLDKTEIIKLWKGRKASVMCLADLYLDILILSCFAPHESQTVEDLFVSTGEVAMDGRKDLNREISDYLKRDRSPENPFQITISQIHKGVLSLAGVLQQCPDGSLPLISSKRGQVVYFSILETMNVTPDCPMRCQVHQGRLQYEGQYYDYATGESSSVTGFEPDMKLLVSETSPMPLAELGSSPSRYGHWFASQGDNCITLSFAPNIEGSHSLNPRVFLHACASTIVLSQCLQPCVRLEDVEHEILYCGSIQAAISNQSPRVLRVVSCGEGNVGRLFVQATMTEFWDGMLSWQDLEAENCITVARGTGVCLPCACKKTLDILSNMIEGRESIVVRAILIT